MSWVWWWRGLDRRALWGLPFLLALALGQVREGFSANPFFPQPVPWAYGMLFPKVEHMLDYCDWYATRSRTAPIDVGGLLERFHRVRWKSGVYFQTPMGTALEACAKGVGTVSFLSGLGPMLFVPGKARSVDEIKAWKAWIILRNAKGEVLARVSQKDLHPFFEKGGNNLSGVAVFSFWNSSLPTGESVVNALFLSTLALVIDFHIQRDGKEEVYSISASDHSHLW